MTYGLHLINGADEVIIDDDFDNMGLYSTGTVANGGIIPLPPSGNHKLFVRPNTDGAWINASTPTWIPGQKRTNYTIVLSSGTADFIMYAPYSEAPVHTPTYGLKVWDSNGVARYDSDVSLFEIEHKYRYEQSDSSLFQNWGNYICGSSFFVTYQLTSNTVTKTFAPTSKRRFVSLPSTDAPLAVTPANGACTSSTASVFPIRFSFTDNNTMLMTPNTQNVYYAGGLRFTGGTFYNGQSVEIGLY